MPSVHFRLTPEGLTAEKKKILIREVTALLKRVLSKNPETTIVTIEEIATDNWGIAGFAQRSALPGNLGGRRTALS
tara:strand:+ start:3283 stop:3510 length:228 start_codon:yes stop_codon:yes gene_type:complete